jgi:hypothetical protein
MGLFAAQPRVCATTNWAIEMVWITADLTERGQCLGGGIVAEGTFIASKNVVVFFGIAREGSYRNPSSFRRLSDAAWLDFFGTLW